MNDILKVMKKCECDERYATLVDTLASIEEVEEFFNDQLEKGIFIDIKVEKPYHRFDNEKVHVKDFASKWYKCTVCGCLWEYDKPNYDIDHRQGFVRKFSDGVYREWGYEDYRELVNPKV